MYLSRSERRNDKTETHDTYVVLLITQMTGVRATGGSSDRVRGLGLCLLGFRHESRERRSQAQLKSPPL